MQRETERQKDRKTEKEKDREGEAKTERDFYGAANCGTCRLDGALIHLASVVRQRNNKKRSVCPLRATDRPEKTIPYYSFTLPVSLYLSFVFSL